MGEKWKWSLINSWATKGCVGGAKCAGVEVPQKRVRPGKEKGMVRWEEEVNGSTLGADFARVLLGNTSGIGGGGG